MTPEITSTSISKAIAANRRQIREARKQAQGTLSPDQMRKALLRGEIDPYEALLWGTREDGTPFTLQDLQQFGVQQKRTKKDWGSKQGAPIVKLLAQSAADDVDRANSEIRGATMHKISGPVLHFHVSASGNTAKAPAFYGVRIRLEDWTDNMASYSDYRDAVKDTLRGNVSIDCNCGRFQFWYRYVATIARCALKPFEKDFPKITNPKLYGMCCKHQLKALKVVLTPTYQKLLAREMERQSQGVGFAGDVPTKALTKEDMKKLSKAKPAAINQARFHAKLKAMESAKKAYNKKTTGQQKDAAFVAQIEREKKKLEAKLRQVERQLQNEKNKARIALERRELGKSKAGIKLTKDQLRVGLREEIDRAKMYGSDQKAAIRFFAQKNKISIDKATKIAKEIM